MYGIPASGVLATELYQRTVSNQPLPSSKPRSEIIRTLSFLVSWVQNTVTEEQPSMTPSACLELNNVISKLLDDTLDYQPPLGSGQDDAILGSVDIGQSLGDLPSDVFNGEALGWLNDLDLIRTPPELSLM